MWLGRILLLDDEPAILFGVREFLGALGYCVECARTAAEARERLDRARFDVLIADLRLTPAEPAEGLDVVEWVHGAHPATRVVVLTASGDDFEPEARRRGAHRYLQKPQPLARIAELVKDLCSEASRARGV